MRFQDQVVIVTGAARGLGRRYAERFAEEGAKVAVADLRDDVDIAAKEINDAGGTAIALQVDVNDVAATERMASETVAAFGRIDVLVNNAGIWGDYEVKPLLSVEPELAVAATPTVLLRTRALSVPVTAPAAVARTNIASPFEPFSVLLRMSTV